MSTGLVSSYSIYIRSIIICVYIFVPICICSFYLFPVSFSCFPSLFRWNNFNSVQIWRFFALPFVFSADLFLSSFHILFHIFLHLNVKISAIECFLSFVWFCSDSVNCNTWSEYGRRKDRIFLLIRCCDATQSQLIICHFAWSHFTLWHLCCSVVARHRSSQHWIAAPQTLNRSKQIGFMIYLGEWIILQ